MDEQTSPVDADLLALLACPACEDRPPVRLTDNGLVCDRCHRVYPIRDGIPEMLVEAASFEPGYGPSEP